MKTLLAVLLICGNIAAQQSPGMSIKVDNLQPERQLKLTHRFWDRTNTTLFGVDTLAQTFDMVSTQSIGCGHRGLYVKCVESNPVARPFEYGGYKTAFVFHYGINLGGSTLAAYLLHRTNHHRLERFAHAVDIYSGVSCGINNMRIAHSGRMFSGCR